MASLLVLAFVTSYSSEYFVSITWDLGGNMSLVFSFFVNLTAKFFANRNLLASNVSKFVILEFQGPYGPLGNSSPCGGHARSARMASCFARKVTLEDLDF